MLISLSLSCLSSSNHLHFRFDIFFIFPYRVLSKPKYPRTVCHIMQPAGSFAEGVNAILSLQIGFVNVVEWD
jgi:hypothetical protein